MTEALAYGGLVLAGIGAGALNAIAGGGSLITFPSLVGFGLADKLANATNACALVPGTLSALGGYRDCIQEVKPYMFGFTLPTTVGSVLGTAILLQTTDEVFRWAVPVLILFATVLLAVQPRIKAWTATHQGTISPRWGWFFQFLISIYGGYFGAGMGILMLAYMGATLPLDLHAQNALKGYLATIINLVAAVVFIAKGLIVWGPCVAVLVGSVIGGYVAARLAIRSAPEKVRPLVIAVGVIMTVVFGVRLCV